MAEPTTPDQPSPLTTIEIVRRLTANGFETLSYKVTAAGETLDALDALSDAIMAIELTYGRVHSDNRHDRKIRD